jgi:hypothetical protein
VQDTQSEHSGKPGKYSNFTVTHEHRQKNEGKDHLRTSQEGPKGEQRNSFTLSLRILVKIIP